MAEAENQINNLMVECWGAIKAMMEIRGSRQSVMGQGAIPDKNLNYLSAQAMRLSEERVFQVEERACANAPR